MSLVEGLLKQLAGGGLNQVSQTLGTDESAAARAVGAALPMILGALAKNAQSDDGAAALSRALNRDHDGSALDNVAGTLSGYQTGPGAGILKHVFGERRGAVEQGLAKSTGIDPAKAGALLTMLAPLVMGALGKAQRTDALDPGGLAAMLGQERQRIPGGSSNPLLRLLDTDGDGSIIDDVGGFLGKMMGR
jgi:hypothetical protein